jgi:hypothetical protein
MENKWIKINNCNKSGNNVCYVREGNRIKEWLLMKLD